MAKKSTKNAVATTGTTTDLTAFTQESISIQLDKYRKMLAELKQQVPENLSTNIEYITATGSTVNISKVEKLSTLMEISASIQARNTAYEIEVKRYKIEGKVKPFMSNDKTAEQWFEIIEKAVFELMNKNRISQLEKTIDRLSKFEDEKTKLAREINAIVEEASELLD